MLGLARLRVTVLAVLPLYAPENVRVESPAVRVARSLVNCESENDEVAVVPTIPPLPMKAIPCDREVSHVAPVLVRSVVVA